MIEGELSERGIVRIPTSSGADKVPFDYVSAITLCMLCKYNRD